MAGKKRSKVQKVISIVKAKGQPDQVIVRRSQADAEREAAERAELRRQMQAAAREVTPKVPGVTPKFPRLG